MNYHVVINSSLAPISCWFVSLFLRICTFNSPLQLAEPWHFGSANQAGRLI